MKNHKFSILAVSLILLAISIAFASCEGPEGPRGPAGPTGPQGDMLPYIPVESGIRGTTWVNETYNITAFFDNDGYGGTITSADGSTSFTVISYAKRPDGTHVIGAGRMAFVINDDTLTSPGVYTGNFTKRP